MSQSPDWISQHENFFTPNYKPAPFVVAKAKGSWLWDLEGERYLDFTSGIAVNNLGHCPDTVVKAVQKQAAELMHLSNLFWNQPTMKLAKILVDHSFADKVFFTNSGTESIEAALKVARKYFYDQKATRKKFVSFLSGFHGRSFGALSATPKESYREPYQPVVPGFEFAQVDDLDELRKIDEETAAVLLEPIQGEGGVYPIEPSFAQAIRKRCDETGSLLILDCIQVGLRRAGSLWGYEQLGIEPDVITLAKGLGNGFPIGAMLCTEKVGTAFQVGAHGTTFGGNPMACAAALAVLEQMQDSNFVQTCERHSQRFFDIMNQELAPHPRIQEIRGRGHMIGIEIKGELGPVFEALRLEKVLVTRILPQTLRVLPPLCATEEEFQIFIAALLKALSTTPS